MEEAEIDAFFDPRAPAYRFIADRFLRPSLNNGWPIATGAVESACRHLIADRLDITGARWGLPGAEAVLRLRAVVSNGDLDPYRRYHAARGHERL